MTGTTTNPDIRKLDRAFDHLRRHLPDWIGRCLEWVRSPQARWWRIVIAAAMIFQSVFWFLPVFGLEFLPLGLLLLAQDIPWLRRPTARLVMCLLYWGLKLKQWWKRRWTRHRYASNAQIPRSKGQSGSQRND